MATTQNSAALLKAQDLQVAKGTNSFSMTHKMGLAVITLVQKTVKTSRTVTYNSTYPNGNISDGSTKSVRASGSFKTNIMWNKDGANVCYFVVKPGQTWTFDSTEQDAEENAWVQDIDCSPSAGKYYSYNASPRDILTFTAIFAHRTAGYTFTVPMYACYKLEVWGASGGGNQPANPIVTGSSIGSCGGLGGYSYGHKSLAASRNIYVYVGGQGKSTETANGTGLGAYGGGWNGGGDGYGYLYYSSTGGEGYGGGGMTHISTTQNPSRPVNSVWSPTGTLIVAGGGGGADDARGGTNTSGYWKGGNDGTGGYGGGSQGGQGLRNGLTNASDSPIPRMRGGDNTPGVTYPGYAQGVGESASGGDAGGGGGGWYGGYANTFSSGGGGGTGCAADVGYPSATIAGNPEAATATIPAPGSFTSTSNVKGNWGNGFARITFAHVSRAKLD